MIQIKPIQIPLRNTEANFIKMRSEFDLNSDKSIIQWFIYNSEQQIITNGTLDIPIEVHNAWQDDDTIIEDYVLSKLKLKRL